MLQFRGVEIHILGGSFFDTFSLLFVGGFLGCFSCPQVVAVLGLEIRHKYIWVGAAMGVWGGRCRGGGGGDTFCTKTEGFLAQSGGSFGTTLSIASIAS